MCETKDNVTKMADFKISDVDDNTFYTWVKELNILHATGELPENAEIKKAADYHYSILYDHNRFDAFRALVESECLIRFEKNFIPKT